MPALCLPNHVTVKSGRSTGLVPSGAQCTLLTGMHALLQVLREHSAKPGHEFLNGKRKAKIAELVEKYVARGAQ